MGKNSTEFLLGSCNCHPWEKVNFAREYVVDITGNAASIPRCVHGLVGWKRNEIINKISKMQDFARKRNALFARLDEASKGLKGTALDQTGNDCSAINIFKQTGTGTVDFDNRSGIEKRSRTHHNASLSTNRSLSWLRGKESIFKKPELPISKCLKPRKTPDYKMNPHKWKKYTLSDVDISDQTNNRAAFTFLSAIDEQREIHAALEDNANDSKDAKIQFNRLSIIKRQMTRSDEIADEEVDRPQLKGSKFVMPQYVVGQRCSKKKRQGTTSVLQKRNTNTGKQLNLSHLLDYDDDE